MVEYEAYTRLLIKKEELEKEIENTNVQMSYLLMNIRKGNFRNEATKKHAMKELNYLITSSEKLVDKSKELGDIANSLFNDLYKEDRE